MEVLSTSTSSTTLAILRAETSKVILFILLTVYRGNETQNRIRAGSQIENAWIKKAIELYRKD